MGSRSSRPSIRWTTTSSAGCIPSRLEADLAGNYVSLAKFINALERDDMFFIISSITLAGEQKGPIKLQMKLETYLKAGG